MKNLSIARAILMTEAPFDASLLYSMEFHTTEDSSFCPTACTDCVRHVWFNTKWAENFSPHTIAFVLAHEARHKLFAHNEGAGKPGVNRMIWNAAADFVINFSLFTDGLTCPDFKPVTFQDFIDGRAIKNAVLYDSLMNPDWGVVTVYEYLLSRMRKEGGASNFDAPPKQPPESMDSSVDIATAAAAAKAMGKVPKSLSRIIDDALTPKIDWRELLKTYVVEAAGRGEYAESWSYRRPNRRSGEIILPVPHRPPKGEIVVVVDTSGSISSHELNAFAAEIKGIHEDIRPSCTHVVFADAKVQSVTTFNADDTVHILEARGGGGTDFRPAFKWVKEPPMCLIYLTDGCGTFPSEPPTYPTIWAMTTGVTPPFGRVVHLEV